MEEDFLSSISNHRLTTMNRIRDPNIFKKKAQQQQFELQKARRNEIIKSHRQYLPMEVSQYLPIQCYIEEQFELEYNKTTILSLYSPMINVPSNLSTNWLIYAIPDGTKCFLVSFHNTTEMYDKNKKLIMKANTLLPGGNIKCTNTDKTIVQGIYNAKEKIVYLTDVFMWENQLFNDKSANVRLEFLTKKINSDPLIGEVFHSVNEILIRIPQIRECSKESLELMYYGLSTERANQLFLSEYAKLADYAFSTGFLKINPLEAFDTAKMIHLCIAYSFDNKQRPYLKHGIAFVEKNKNFVSGYSCSVLKWRDLLTDYRIYQKLQNHILAHLYYDKDNTLRTYDKKVVYLDGTMNTCGLKVGTIYSFAYTDVRANNEYIILENAKLYENTKKAWSRMDSIIEKIMVIKNSLPYNLLENIIEQQSKHTY